MQRRESVHVGGVDVGAPLDEPQHLVLVAGRARRQEHAAVGELHRSAISSNQTSMWARD